MSCVILELTADAPESHTQPDFAPYLGDGPTCPVSVRREIIRDRAVLVRMSGADLGRLHPLGELEVTLGRGATCTVRFDDVTLSRVHARILREGADFVVEDAGSLNGTWVNEERVTRAVLRDADRVRLGSGASMRFQILDADEQRAMGRMYEASTSDGLTGVMNRRKIEERLAEEVAAAGPGGSLSVLMLDLDRFKRINDSHGHLAGDAVLKAFAKAASSAVRGSDAIGRWGGEEFVVLLRGAPLEQARMVAERVRLAVERAEVPYGDGVLKVTCSVGVASLDCVGSEPRADALVACADERLYRAKGQGRNRVCWE